MQIKTLLKTFVKDETGAAMVEYGVALLVVTAIGVGTMSILGEGTGELVTGACGIIEASDQTTVSC